MRLTGQKLAASSRTLWSPRSSVEGAAALPPEWPAAGLCPGPCHQAVWEPVVRLFLAGFSLGMAPLRFAELNVPFILKLPCARGEVSLAEDGIHLIQSVDKTGFHPSCSDRTQEAGTGPLLPRPCVAPRLSDLDCTCARHLKLRLLGNSWRTALVGRGAVWCSVPAGARATREGLIWARSPPQPLTLGCPFLQTSLLCSGQLRGPACSAPAQVLQAARCFTAASWLWALARLGLLVLSRCSV